MLEDISVPAARHLPEEAAADGGAAVRDALVGEMCLRAFDDVRKVEHDAARTGRDAEDAGEERTVASVIGARTA